MADDCNCKHCDLIRQHARQESDWEEAKRKAIQSEETEYRKLAAYASIVKVWREWQASDRRLGITRNRIAMERVDRILAETEGEKRDGHG